jgi:hypothetical protein
LAEAIRVRDHVDFGDLAICDREAEYQEQPSTGGHHESDRSVYKRRLGEPGPFRGGERALGMPISPGR